MRSTVHSHHRLLRVSPTALHKCISQYHHQHQRERDGRLHTTDLIFVRADNLPGARHDARSVRRKLKRRWTQAEGDIALTDLENRRTPTLALLPFPCLAVCSSGDIRFHYSPVLSVCLLYIFTSLLRLVVAFPFWRGYFVQSRRCFVLFTGPALSL
jgi:hypothetical protein